MRGPCEDCLFWDEFYRDETKLAHGLCRRYAPHPVIKSRISDEGAENVEWPITRMNEGCGEYQPNDQIQP